MAIAPVVRYMLLCDDWRLDGPDHRRVTIVGLIWSIHSVGDPPYPFVLREFCVFLALTAVRGRADGHITCVFEDDGGLVFETLRRPIPVPADPLEVVGVSFRIQDCVFPRPGRYTIQFWYDDVLVEERPLKLR